MVSIKTAGHGHMDVDILQSSPLSAAKTVSHHPFVVAELEEVAVRVQFKGTGTVKVESISLAKLSSG